ncbi:MAG: helicase HerA domain-containing protein, partial [Gammaproteobacteria bacterium]
MLDDTAFLGTRTSGLDLACPVTLSEDDRRRHLYIVGKTGTGKSTLIMSLILADLKAGRGLAFLDPHGDQAK